MIHKSFFTPAVIDNHASTLHKSTKPNLASMFSGEPFDHFTKSNKSGRTAKRVRTGGPVLYDDFSHPLAKEGGFWGINSANGHQVLRRYDPQMEPIDLTGGN